MIYLAPCLSMVHNIIGFWGETCERVQDWENVWLGGLADIEPSDDHLIKHFPALRRSHVCHPGNRLRRVL